MRSRFGSKERILTSFPRSIKDQLTFVDIAVPIVLADEGLFGDDRPSKKGLAAREGITVSRVVNLIWM